ncbi:MAG: TetR/AcrR family transcriptional regulator [Candidatus Dormibacteria bacterium]
MPAAAGTKVPPPRRQTLVLAAYRQLAEHGFEGLRTRQVAAAAGVNVATLHYYFPSKEALIEAVLGHTMERFRSTVGGSASTGDQLRQHFAGIRRLQREEPELFTVMGELALRAARDPAVRVLYQKTTAIWRQTVRAMLVKASADGSLAELRDPDSQASLVVATIMGACMMPVGRPATRREALQELQRALGLDPR